MSLEVCDDLIKRLSQEFGSPWVHGTFHRWVVSLPGQPLGLIIGLDRCDDTPITIWTVDANQSSVRALRHYKVHDAHTAATAIEQILEYIRLHYRNFV